MVSELRERLVMDLARHMQDLSQETARELAHDLTLAASTVVAQRSSCTTWPQVDAFPVQIWNEMTVGVPWEAFSRAHGVLKDFTSTKTSRAVCSAPSRLDANLIEYASSSRMWGGSLLTAVGEVMREAKRELMLFAPYWRIDGVNMLISAAGRASYIGIDVLVVTQPQHRMCEEDTSGLIHFINRMTAAQAIVQVISPKSFDGGAPIAHAKLLVADAEVAYVGSANFTGSGMNHGLEAGAIVAGHVAKDLAKWVMALKSICDPWSSLRPL